MPEQDKPKRPTTKRKPKAKKQASEADDIPKALNYDPADLIPLEDAFQAFNKQFPDEFDSAESFVTGLSLSTVLHENEYYALISNVEEEAKNFAKRKEDDKQMKGKL